MRLMIYELLDEQGEKLEIKVRATGEIKKFKELELGDLVDFPQGREVIIYASSSPLELRTARRTKDNMGIELISRNKTRRNVEGKPYSTIYPSHVCGIVGFSGQGYLTMNKLLKKYRI